MKFNRKIMIHAWLQCKFKEICQNCLSLLDLSKFGDNSMPLNNQL
jgi:hypothetical protein